MAKFYFKTIKLGYEGQELKTVISLYDIDFEDGDEVVELPSTYEGNIVTHFGYSQGFNEAHVRFHDWHHPAQGEGDYCPAEYVLNYGRLLYRSSTLKKVIFPKTAKVICLWAYNHLEGVEFEIPNEVQGYKTQNGKIEYK